MIMEDRLYRNLILGSAGFIFPPRSWKEVGQPDIGLVLNQTVSDFSAADFMKYQISIVIAVGMGMSAKMFPETDKLLKAMAENLDFFVE